MASQQPPPPPKSPSVPYPTTISAIGDDLLREIFLRLPSLPSLVRAALTCRSFLHAVRSSSSFRRRFRAIHQSPLLGLFFDPDGPAIPAFAPLRRRSDPDLVAAVRGADFFLTRLPDDNDAAPGWEIRDCRGGYLLLINWSTEQIAAYNPLTRAMDLLSPPPDEISDDCIGYFTYLDYHILSSDEEPGSFRVVCACHDESRARAAVLSSDTREWLILPWAAAATPQPEDDKYWLYAGTLVNGIIYWTHTNQAYMLTLDTASLQFSRIDLPPYLKGQGHTFRAGETKDGKLCIVCTIEFTLVVWYRRVDEDGDEKWMLDKMFPLQTEIVEATEGSLEDHGALKVVAIIDGLVYLSTYETFNDADFPCWFLSFCLETGELEKLFQKRYDSHVHPYIMAWPPSLVGNTVDPGFEGA
ncbi:uncharacterized protein LOC133897404 [Phragmites australis]|uniref:uncharacterized protein LOC133897404 n=1 Tax=Phragmites australis TaxID=29695 RepID=UPI002D77ED83|nr:uncharacterized protein LOC133897404 [Phragmites australis]XP_062194117.1 uncharacterized protein LOC133897404 [Phragmites australis]